MTALADPGLYADLRAFGADEVPACFSCGTCTATCPLVEGDGAFPRRIIRYAQVGLKDQLLASKEIWSCYQCADCSDSCPTGAGPSEFMAAARRYAIASYDKTHLARTMYLRPIVGTVIAIALAVLFAAFMVAGHGAQDPTTLAIFDFVPEELIHEIGIAVMVVVAIAGAVGIASMTRRIARRDGVSLRSLVAGRAALRRTTAAAWQAVAVESLGQRRFRAECEADEAALPRYRRRWFLHAATMWGFLGLFAATILDYGLDIIGVKETGTPVPIWYPVRLLGTVAGVLLVYGTTMLIVDRARKANGSVRRSFTADWTLLILLWVVGVSGFLLELGLYLPSAPGWGYWVFLFHVALAMELILLAPFMKLAHAVYRPIALFFVALARGGAPSTPGAADGG
ncbi:MAG: 4Fe-4S dicluster domain-containing protein [Chloroflexota bacterium]